MQKILALGSCLPVNAQGFLDFQPDPNLLQHQWRTLLEEVITHFREHYGETLKSVYVRGTVAKGMAIDHVSDLDTVALLHKGATEMSPSWTHPLEKILLQRYPFCTGVEFIVLAPESLETIKPPKTVNVWKRLLKTQALCVFGEDITPSILPVRLGPNMVSHIFSLEHDLPREPLPDSYSSERKKSNCTWLMKRIVRSGFELVMEKEQTFTRDLYPCYAGFIKYHPEWEREMRAALELAVFPTDDFGKIESIVRGLGQWLAVQGENWKQALSAHSPCAPLD